MAERPTFLTREGMQKIEGELEYLRTVRRQEVAHRLHEAMEGGDVQENAEYEDARNERAFVEGRILKGENTRAAPMGKATIPPRNAPLEPVNHRHHSPSTTTNGNANVLTAIAQ